MPPDGQQFLEVYLAECDEKNAEHEYRQYAIVVRIIPLAYRLQSRNKVKQQIYRYAHGNRNGQSPVLQKTNH